MIDKDFYRAFEEKYRGSRVLIKNRLKVYLPFIIPFKDIYDECNMLDIGCGRGEWLELMVENGFNVIGVDLDDGMLNACKELGLNAINKDALLALKELPEESQVVVSGFHIAEHLPFEILLEIVKEAKRVLKPAGMLILETPNPANIYVGTNSFYFDPTHNRPIPSELLSFLPEFYGYTRIKVLGLQEDDNIDKTTSVSIFDVYKNSSPDYAVVAQKNEGQNILSLFDDAFAKNYGLNISTLCDKFENGLTNRFSYIEAKAQSAEAKAQSAEAKAQSAEAKAQSAETKAQSAEAKAQSAEAKAQSAETKAQSAEAKAQSAEVALNAIYTSRSWKITAPYRALGDFTKNSKQKTKATLKPFAAQCITFIIKHPKLKKQIVKRLRIFPKIESRLRLFFNDYYTHNKSKHPSSVKNEDSDLLQLTPEAIKVYKKLNQRFKKKRGPQ